MNAQDRDAGPSAHSGTAPVSVIIPCYCCADTVGRAVASVVAQTLRPRELVLVDDASPDQGRTLAVLHALAREHGQDLSVIVAQREINGGPSAARNRAWEAATQPYLAFLDADDAWHPSKIAVQFAFMQANPQATLSAHATLLMRPGQAWPALPSDARPHQVSALRLLLRNCLPTRTVMLRRDAGGRFEEDKRHSEDYLLWLRLVLRGASAWRFELPLACSFKGDAGAGGLSGSLWRMRRGELDTYARLQREGLLPIWLHAALVCVSLAKFAVRSAWVALARLFTPGGGSQSSA